MSILKIVGPAKVQTSFFTGVSSIYCLFSSAFAKFIEYQTFLSASYTIKNYKPQKRKKQYLNLLLPCGVSSYYKKLSSFPLTFVYSFTKPPDYAIIFLQLFDMKGLCIITERITKMKNIFKRSGILALLLFFITTAVTGCSGERKEEPVEEVEEPVYPVTIDDVEIRIGETTVQSLLDKGFKMTVSELTPDNEYYEYEIDPELELEANSYYTGGSIWITDQIFVHISIVTDEKAIRMGDAVIAYLDFSLAGGDEADLERIAFNGVPITELNRDKAGEMFPDFTGDENMWFSPYTMKEYSYFLGFNSQTDYSLMRFSVEKEYDVDWNSEQ